MITFSQGLKYPWVNGKRLWNILWIFIPILGALAMGGYIKKIAVTIAKGNTQGLPEFGGFWDNLSVGFMFAVKMIPLMLVVMVVSFVPFLGGLAVLVFGLLFLPWLVINLMVKDTVGSSFELGAAAHAVFNNFGDYVVTILKTIGYAIIYAIASIVLVGIPCLYFGQQIFLADFYARTSKGVKVAKTVAPAKTVKKV